MVTSRGVEEEAGSETTTGLAVTTTDEMLWSTWTCALGVRRRCRPRGGGIGPASDASGPSSGLETPTQTLLI